MQKMSPTAFRKDIYQQLGNVQKADGVLIEGQNLNKKAVLLGFNQYQNLIQTEQGQQQAGSHLLNSNLEHQLVVVNWLLSLLTDKTKFDNVAESVFHNTIMVRLKAYNATDESNMIAGSYLFLTIVLMTMVNDGMDLSITTLKSRLETYSEFDIFSLAKKQRKDVKSICKESLTKALAENFLYLDLIDDYEVKLPDLVEWNLKMLSE